MTPARVHPLLPAALLLLCGSAAAAADEPPSAAPQPLDSRNAVESTFADYRQSVLRENLDLAAQRAGVNAAEAQIAVARIFPDPQLSLGMNPYASSGFGSPFNFSAGLSTTVELGGKRGARTEAATLDREAAVAGLADFLRGLEAQAAGNFIDALAARLVLKSKQRTLNDLEKLVGVNEQRLRAGDVGELAVVQSRIEARRFAGEVLAARADVRAADLALLTLLGPDALRAPLAPKGELQFQPRTFDGEALSLQARESRPDVVQKRKAMEAAKARIGLAEANRWIDLSPGVTWTHQGAADGAPAQDALGVGLSLPLPLSRVYKGELEAARANAVGAEAALRAQALRAQIDLRTALERHQASAEQVRLYLGGVLTDADRVLEAVRYNYTKGGATLLELLDAQRTANDVHLSWAQALQAHAKALVAVEQAAGLPVDF